MLPEKCARIRCGDTHNSALQSAVDEFLAELTAKNYSPASVGKRRDSLRKFLLFLECSSVGRFQDVTPEMLEEYRSVLAADDYSPYSVESYLRSMRLFLGWLTDRCVLFENPAATFHIGKSPVRLGCVLSEAQVKKLLAQPDLGTVCGLRNRAILEVLYGTGIRRGELLSMSVSDFETAATRIRVRGKGRKERALPLGHHAVTYLARYTADARPELVSAGPGNTDALWCSRYGRALDANMIPIMIAQYAKSARIRGPVSSHTLRRTCATHLLRNGAHPVAVAELLGHSSLRSLSHYLKTTITDMMKTHAKTKPGA